MGFRTPNHTQVPNEFFEHWLPQLGLAETKVLLVIFRKTFGWHKIRDQISLTQIENATGLERTHITKAIKSLIEKNLIKKELIGEPGDQKTFYELVLTDDSNNSYQCRKDTPPSVVKTPTKETSTKEKEDCLLPPPVGDGDSPKSIKKFTTDAKQINFELDTVFRRAVQTNQDWKTSEIKEAWEILVKYEGRVNDCMAFIEGTIKNLRKSKISKNINERENQCPAIHEIQARRPTMADLALAERPSHLAEYVRQTKGK